MKRIGEILLENNEITEPQLRKALKYQEIHGGKNRHYSD